MVSTNKYKPPLWKRRLFAKYSKLKWNRKKVMPEQLYIDLTRIDIENVDEMYLPIRDIAETVYKALSDTRPRLKKQYPYEEYITMVWMIITDDKKYPHLDYGNMASTFYRVAKRELKKSGLFYMDMDILPIEKTTHDKCNAILNELREINPLYARIFEMRSQSYDIKEIQKYLGVSDKTMTKLNREMEKYVSGEFR